MALATEPGVFSSWSAGAFLQGWLLVEEGHEQAGITEMAKKSGSDRTGECQGGRLPNMPPCWLTHMEIRSDH